MTPAVEAEKPKQGEPSAREWHERWTKELSASHEELSDWHEEGKKIVAVFTVEEGGKGMNLFTVNVETQLSLLFGAGTPKVSVDRRYADASDDTARVASELLERSLNADLEKTGDSYATALENSLKDRMLPGCGQARVRYVAEFEDVPEKPALRGPDGAELAPMVPASKRKTYECVHTDYVHWKDFRWSPARVWDGGVRWVAFGSDLSLAQLTEKFGKEIAAGVPLSNGNPKDDEEAKRKDPLARARVWEIWDATTRKVFWHCDGAGACLRVEDDPLGLERFFPCPKPMFSLLSTSKVLPTPDYRVAKGLYEEVDSLTERISLLTEALKVAGVYDNRSEQIKRLLSEKKENVLIAVDNWAAFGEKGGLRGSVDFMPLDQVVAAIAALQQQRMQAKQDLYEVTGLSDILRGQGQGPGVTLGEQELKAQFASARMQRVQGDVVRFASEIQALKAEVMAKHFDPETILKQANAEHMDEDPALLQQAAALIKSGDFHKRVVVQPESVSAQAFAQLSAEGSQLLQTIVSYMQAMGPLVQQIPGSLPFLLRMLQAHVAGSPAAKRFEGVLDQAIQAAEQMAQQAPQGQQDGKLQAQILKGQQEEQKQQRELQGDLVRIQAETAAKGQQESIQREQNVLEAAQKQILSQAMKPNGVGPTGGIP
jgi:hypothetical protein